MKQAKSLRVLEIADFENRFVPEVDKLRSRGFRPITRLVRSDVELLEALETGWDLVLCDFAPTTLTAAEALSLLRKKHSGTPFIVLADQAKDEEAADLIRSGATAVIARGRENQVAAIIDRELLQSNIVRQREAELKTLTDHSPDVISRFDRELRYVYISPVIELYTGMPVERFVGKTHRELALPDSLCTVFETALNLVFRTGTEQNTEFSYKTLAGTRTFRGTIVPERNAAGEIESALSVTHDVTALRRSELHLMNAQRIANVGSWEVHLKTGRRRWSREVFRIMGLPVGEPPPEAEVLAAIPEEDRPAVVDAHRLAIETGQTQRAEHRIILHDGSERIFSIAIDPQKNPDGEPVSIIGTIQDVTAVRNTERSLRQSEQRMRDLIDSANDAIIILDTTGRVMEVNPALIRMIGKPADALIGRHVTQSIHPDHVDKVMTALSSVLRTGSLTHIQAPMRTAGGKHLLMEGTASRQTRDGADAIFVIGRDITQRVQAEAERRALEAELERANRLAGLGRVAALMSHEFNNVLMGIQPFAEILGRSAHDAASLHAVHRINQSVKRGRRVTGELRRFTAPVDPIRRPVEVEQWLSSCAAELNQLIPPHIRLSVAVNTPLLTVEADREQISQVVSNLVLNASEAISAKAGTITIVAEAARAQDFPSGTLPQNRPFAHFTVTDDGRGIPAKDLTRVTEPFFSTRRNGSGLGLAVCEQIVTLHGGFMFIESIEGRGTKVHFSLERSSVLEQEPASPLQVPERRKETPSEILLVEDDETVAAGLCALFDLHGTRVLLATTGAEAMRMLETARPQALILDIGLPDCDGVDLYERITSRFGVFPTVFSSGHTDRLETIGLGTDIAVRILTKPYQFEDLLEQLDNVCMEHSVNRDSRH